MALYPRRNPPRYSLFRDDLLDLFGQHLNIWNGETGQEIEIHGQDRPKDTSKTVLSFPLGECKADNIKVDIKEGMLHVECKEEKDGSFNYIKYERTVPKDVDPNTLKAKLLADGTLQFRVEKSSDVEQRN